MANRPTKEQAKKIAELQNERAKLGREISAHRAEGAEDSYKKEVAAIERVLEINDELVAGDTGAGAGVTNEPESRKGENFHVAAQALPEEEQSAAVKKAAAQAPAESGARR